MITPRIRYPNGPDIVFPLPPDMDYPEQKIPKNDIVEAISGQRQVTNLHTATILYQKFSLLELSFIKGELEPFFEFYALRGNDFLYFPDSNDFAIFDSWHLDKYEFKPVKNENSINLYDIDFTLRRI